MADTERLNRFLSAFAASLGGDYEQLRRDLGFSSAPKFKYDGAVEVAYLWNGGDPPKKSVSLCLEPSRFHDVAQEAHDAASAYGLALEVDVAIQDRRAKSYGSTKKLAHAMAQMLVDAFPELGASPSDFIQLYPNSAEPPPRGIFIWDSAVPEEVDWQGCVDLCIRASPIRFDEDPEAAARTAADELRPHWPIFRRAVDWCRGHLSPGSAPERALRDEELMGLLGEAAFALQHGDAGVAWIGGSADRDFDRSGRSIEVKTGVGGCPTAPFLTESETNLAACAPERWDLALVGLRADLFSRAREYLDDLPCRPKRPSFPRQLLSTDVVGLAVNRLVATAGLDTFFASSGRETEKTMQRIRELVAGLQVSEMARVELVDVPFARGWRPLLEARRLIAWPARLRVGGVC